MNSNTQCPACHGGGLVPARGCACNGSAHTCLPASCTMCDGSGRVKDLRATHVPHARRTHGQPRTLAAQSAS